MITLNDIQLMNIAKSGEVSAAKALSVLSKRKVLVETKKAKIVPYKETMAIFEKIEEHAVVAYMQAITGINGISILSMERTEALRLVDLFNGRPENTTKIMQEIDRSTIRETLNILANAYATKLGNDNKTNILLGVPSMVTRAHLKDAMEKVEMSSQEEDKAFIFETDLAVDETEFKVSLYFFFLAGASEK
jgi:chemotaxis protein CheY-P-specific phosphatase CheC